MVPDAVKRIAKGSQLLLDIHSLMYLRQFIPLNDYANLEKLLLFVKVRRNTQVGYKRLTNAYELAKRIEKEKLGGAIVECGVWKGGCAGVMAYVADRAGYGRRIWLFDSFEGMPEATAEDAVDEKAVDLAKGRVEGKLVPVGTNIAGVQDVEKLLFGRLGIDRRNVVIVKGWFQDTLQKNKEKVGEIAILRVDGDWYESTKVCLEGLYDNVVSGGFVIIDDYGYFAGCKKAVDEFVKKRGLSIKLEDVDGEAVFFQKPAA